VLSRGFGRLLSAIALIDISERDALAGGVLDGFGKASHLGTIVDIGGGDVQGEQMAERVHRQMEFRAALAFGTVVAGTLTAFRCRAQGAAVNDGGRRFGRAAGGKRACQEFCVRVCF